MTAILCLTRLMADQGPDTLQQRIDSTPEGAALEIRDGVHRGPIRINKSITLTGIGRPVIDGGRAGHIIHVLADDVAIEGFVLRASGSSLGRDHAAIMVEGNGVRIEDNLIEDALHGIYLKKAAGGRIIGNRIAGKQHTIEPIGDVIREGARPVTAELCAVPLGVNQRGNGIHLWNSPGNRIEDSVVTDTRDGIYFSFSDNCIVRRNLVRLVRYGLHYMYSDENVFEHNRFEQNAAGAALMYSKQLFVHGNTFAGNDGRRAYGILIQSVDETTFLDNLISRNTVGVYLENSNRNRFAGNTIVRNYIGVRLTNSSADNAFSRNRLTGNLHSVETDQAIVGNSWATEGTGNFWAGTGTVDLDGDQRSELPHYEADPLGSIRRGFPEVGLLTRTPVLQLLQFAQSRIPIPGLPTIKDPAPLTRAPAGP